MFDLIGIFNRESSPSPICNTVTKHNKIFVLLFQFDCKYNLAYKRKPKLYLAHSITFFIFTYPMNHYLCYCLNISLSLSMPVVNSLRFQQVWKHIGIVLWCISSISFPVHHFDRYFLKKKYEINYI